MSSAADMRSLMRLVRKAGWGVRMSKGQHWIVTPPEGRDIYVSSTPSDRRALQNVKAHLRRAGFEFQ